jgi:hypothetical protein
MFSNIFCGYKCAWQTKVGAVVTRYTGPLVSLQLSELGLGVTIAIGAWAVRDVAIKELTYMWGFSIGIFLGWFYPVENMYVNLSRSTVLIAELLLTWLLTPAASFLLSFNSFFSLAVPKHQEAELAGFL